MSITEDFLSQLFPWLGKIRLLIQDPIIVPIGSNQMTFAPWLYECWKHPFAIEIEGIICDFGSKWISQAEFFPFLGDRGQKWVRLDLAKCISDSFWTKEMMKYPNVRYISQRVCVWWVNIKKGDNSVHELNVRLTSILPCRYY